MSNHDDDNNNEQTREYRFNIVGQVRVNSSTQYPVQMRIDRSTYPHVLVLTAKEDLQFSMSPLPDDAKPPWWRTEWCEQLAMITFFACIHLVVLFQYHPVCQMLMRTLLRIKPVRWLLSTMYLFCPAIWVDALREYCATFTPIEEN